MANTALKVVFGLAVAGLGIYGITRPSFMQAVAEYQEQQNQSIIGVIEDNNFHNVQLGDTDYFACSKHETGVQFTAQNMSNRTVSGVACYQPGGYKGVTLRFPR